VKSVTLRLCSAVLLITATCFAQSPRRTLRGYSVVRPAPNFSWEDANAIALSPATTGLPIWTRTVNASKNSKNYSIVMVGRDPSTSTVTTSVPTLIIPVIVKIGTTMFNPTVADKVCMVAPNNVPLSVFKQSPLFVGHTFTMDGVSEGSTQYVDAFQRANFKTEVVASYHTKLGAITIKPAQTFTVPTTAGAVYSTASFGKGGCGPNRNPAGVFGVVDVNTVDNWVMTKALPAAGATASQFPILLLYNVVMSNGAPTILNCCILGYHGATAGPPGGKTYSPMEFDQTGIFGASVNDTSVAAHEIGEWMDDPYGHNPTPAWGGIGQVSGCQSNLEDGDPLSGRMFPAVKMSNGFSYHLQELAFLSWFYNAQSDPSIGAGGKFSDNGSFKGPAKVCPPGGTF
jgi:hypothetical protein